MSMQGDRGLVERRAQALRQLQGIIVGPEMAEEQTWLLVQHVAVQGGYLDPVTSQGLDDGVDLVGRQNEVAGDRRFTAARRLEADRFSDSHGTARGELHAAFTDWIA